MSYDAVTVGPYETDGVVVTVDSTTGKIFVELAVGINDAPFVGLVDKLINNGEAVPFYIEPYCRNRPCNRYSLEPNLVVRCPTIVDDSHILPTLRSLRNVIETQNTFKMRLNYTFNNVEVKVTRPSVSPISIITYDSIDIELKGPLFASDIHVGLT